ncbi:hypothetical protein GCM10007053_01290 [Halioglobus pacificus]|uniref:Uncharacterized protein n=2 Tax=Parahalioglobus pacificus TaxID=930806 RepID=A0A919CHF1_9GAMM|nr:hypothetical protein GCM10007053_01290 [Halioglobus pacificus]
MRDYADLLDQAGNALANIYMKKTGLSLEEVTALLSAETWMDGPECVQKGFADKLAEPVKMAATLNPAMFDVYAALPAKAKKLIRKIEPTAEAKQVEAVLAAKKHREEIDLLVGDFADNEYVAPLIASGEIYKLTPEQAGDFILDAIGKNCAPSAPQPLSPSAPQPLSPSAPQPLSPSAPQPLPATLFMPVTARLFAM